MNSSAAAASSTASSPSLFSGLVPGLSVKNPSALRPRNLATPAAGDGVGPAAGRKNQLYGSLFKYGPKSSQIIFSMGDEYVAAYVEKKALVERLSKAMGGAEMVEIERGNHSLSNRTEEAVQAIIDFVRREGPKGWDDPWN